MLSYSLAGLACICGALLRGICGDGSAAGSAYT